MFIYAIVMAIGCVTISLILNYLIKKEKTVQTITEKPTPISVE